MADRTNKSRTTENARPGGFGNRGGHIRGVLATARPKHSGKALRRIWGYLGRQRFALLSVLVITALSTGASLIGPYLIGRAIDRCIVPGKLNGLGWICALLVGVYIVSSLTGWLQAFVMAAVSQRTVWLMRNDLFAKLQDLPLHFFDGKTHGELMSRTTNDIENVNNTLNQSLTQFMTSLFTVAGSLSFMLGLNLWLSLLSFVTIPLIMVTTRLMAKYTRTFFKGLQKNLGDLNGYIEEAVSGQKVIKSFRREEKSIEEFQEINDRLLHVGIRSQIFSGIIFPVMNVFNNLGFALVAGVGGWMAFKDYTTIGIVVSFLNYSKQFSRPLNDLANQFNMIQAAIAGAERVFEIMDMETEYDNDSGSAALPQLRGEVAFERVSFRYKEDVPVLREVSLAARPGETIALVEPTGAGKTTVVNLLNRFYEISEGSITIDGVDIRELDKDNLRSCLGIVLQDAYLFSDTIRENIRYGRLNASDGEVEAAARTANADSFIRKLPDGYDTRLSAEGGNLSQGQRQLITIARAVLADPGILILDEATSSVDTRTEMQIQEAMKKLMKGRTSFVIAHRLSTIREADLILVINGGEIIERGTHEELLTRKGFYYGLYTSQFKRATA